MISGTRSASACSAARVTFSPTTAPIEPPMNPKSMTQMATGDAADGAGAPQRRVAHAGRRLGRRQAVRVALAVDEAERVHRLEAGVVLDPALVVEQLLEPGAGRQPEVVAAGRADPHRLVELLVEEHRLARRALRPEVGRVGVPACAERGQLDRHQSSRRPGDRADGPGHRGAGGPPPAPGDPGRTGQREGGRGEAAPPMSSGRIGSPSGSPSSRRRRRRPRAPRVRRSSSGRRIETTDPSPPAATGRRPGDGRAREPGRQRLLEPERRVEPRQVAGQAVGDGAQRSGRAPPGRASRRRRRRGPSAATRDSGRR